MICRDFPRTLRLASLLAALWSCAPAAASVGSAGGGAEVVPAAASVAPGKLRSAPLPVLVPVRMAAADCAGAAAQAAADSGGQVLSVSSRQQDGRTVCVVTLLVPGSDGGRPRKQTVVLPQ